MPTGSTATSWPATVIQPAVGCIRPSMSRNKVVLPAPLAPTSPTDPAGTSTVNPDRAGGPVA
jgi:hypothetical protein